MIFSPLSTPELMSRTMGMLPGLMNSPCAAHSPAITVAIGATGTTTGILSPGVLTGLTAKPPSTGATATSL